MSTQVVVKTSEIREAFRLLDSLARVTRTPIDALLWMRVQADGSELRLHATNLETAVDVSVAARVGGEPFTTYVRRSRLAAIVRSAKVDEFVMLHGVSELVINGLRGSFSLPTLDDMEPPSVGTGSERLAVAQLRWDQFGMVADRVAPMVSADPLRAQLGAILLELDKGDMHDVATFVATDGTWLAHLRLDVEPLDMEGKPTVRVLLPPSILGLRPLGQDDSSTVVLDLFGGALDDDYAVGGVAGSEYVKVAFSAVSGKYPRWQNVAEQQLGAEVVVRREDLTELLGEASLAASWGDSPVAPGLLAFEKDKLTVAVSDSEAGRTFNGNVECSISGGASPRQIMINLRRLARLVDALDKTIVRMYVDGPSKPLFVKDAGDGYSYLALLMPILEGMAE